MNRIRREAAQEATAAAIGGIVAPKSFEDALAAWAASLDDDDEEERR